MLVFLLVFVLVIIIIVIVIVIAFVLLDFFFSPYFRYSLINVSYLLL